MTSRDDLEELRAQLDWAESQIEAIERDLQAFFDSQPYRGVVEMDAKTGHRTVDLEITRVVPHKIRAAVGAVLGAMRGSLDHLAVALAKRNGATKTSDVYFPISKSEEIFSSDGLKKMKRLAPADIDVIKNLKPYRGGNDLLFLLHFLNTGNKHTRLVMCGGLSTLVGLSPLQVGPGGATLHPFAPLQYRTPVPILTGDFSPDYEINLAVVVTFGESTILRSKPVTVVLRELLGLVHSIIAIFDK